MARDFCSLAAQFEERKGEKRGSAGLLRRIVTDGFRWWKSEGDGRGECGLEGEGVNEADMLQEGAGHAKETTVGFGRGRETVEEMEPTGGSRPAVRERGNW
jgi:hypothetical protein